MPGPRRWATNQTVAVLAQHLTRYTVLPVSRELCAKWAEVCCAAKRKGRPIQTADAWIAASAVYYRVPLITDNRGDYSAVDGLTLLSA
jgi:predicted nucleic acid-binding protein